MKRLKSFVLFLFLSIVAFAQQPIGTSFEHGTLSEALAKAAKNKKGPKLVFLDCYTTWCGPCKNMSEKIFPMEKVGTFFNANFVNIKIDMEKGEGPELAKKFSVKAYPTFLILSADGKEVGRIVGGGDADGFIAKVKKAMDVENSPAAKKLAYEADKSFNKAFAYLEALKNSYMIAEQNKFLQENFSSFKWYEKYSHDMWPFLSTSLAKGDSGIFNDVVKDIVIMYDTFGRDKTNLLLTGYIKQYMIGYLSNKIHGATTADLQKRIDLLAFVNNGDKLADKLAEIAECVVKDDYAAIADIFRPHLIAELSYNDRAIAEKAVVTLKDKIDSKVLYSYFKVMSSSNKKAAEDYAVLAETYKSEK
ncbi:MAG: thioredoxin domain-containing protein [Bacteroidales bacterium]